MFKILRRRLGFQVKVIVTGFNPFGSYSANPSQEAVLELPDIVKFDDKSPEVRVAKLILPTCCLEAFQTLSGEVAASQDESFALVLSGVAGSQDKICLERFALNVRDFRMPDNNGHIWDEEHIELDGPDALRTRVPLKDLCQHLKNAGFACDISNHAGTFVCNETYYRSLFSWQDNPNCRGILFVHVPAYESYSPSNSESIEACQPRQIYTAVLKEIAAYLAR